MSNPPPLDPRLVMCWAGRWAFNGGLWKVPCNQPPIHVIGFGDDPRGKLVAEIHLCDTHFMDVKYLTEQPYMDPDEYRRRRG